MTIKEKQKLCKGCRDDFYNQSGNSTCGHCWSLDTAEVVTRYRIGWWTQPTHKGAFTKVQTLDCHYAPGQYSHYTAEQLPECAKELAEARR